MQTIEETLERYTEAYTELEEALFAVNTANVGLHKVLHNNEEPFKLNDIDGKFTGTVITTPEDVRDMVAGSIIVIGGVEWMLRNDGWVSGYGGNRTHDEMFVSILLHLDHVFLLHKAY